MDKVETEDEIIDKIQKIIAKLIHSQDDIEPGDEGAADGDLLTLIRDHNASLEDRESMIAIGSLGDSTSNDCSALISSYEGTPLTWENWHVPGEAVNIHGVTVQRGYFYCQKTLPGMAIQDFSEETNFALIDLTLPVGAVDGYHYINNDCMGAITYATLSPRSRAAFINWLASTRDDPTAPTAYQTIYFFGLERRIIYDAVHLHVDDNEYRCLFNEVARLALNIRGNQLCSLLRYMFLRRPGIIDIAAISEVHAKTAPSYTTFDFLLALKAEQAQPIPVELALYWVRHHPTRNLRVPVYRCSDQFGRLFELEYTKRYGPGIVVKPGRTPLTTHYLSPSRHLQGVYAQSQCLCSVTESHKAANGLFSIVDIVTDKLSAFSRYVGKRGHHTGDVAALVLLPDELANTENTKVLLRLKQWIDQRCDDKGVALLTMKEIFGVVGMLAPTQANKESVSIINELASKAGYGMAPRIRIHPGKLTMTANAVFYAGGNKGDFEETAPYRFAVLALCMGAHIAGNDQTRINGLHQYIDGNKKINPAGKKSLHAYLLWLSHASNNATLNKCVTKGMRSPTKDELLTLLRKVAKGENGLVGLERINKLKKVYSKLGRDQSDVSEGSFAAQANNIWGVTNKTAEQQWQPIDFCLDDGALTLLESETREVQNALSAIFDEESNHHQAQPTIAPLRSHYEGLNPQHQALFERMTIQAQWSRPAVEAMCQSLGLMTDGALETINDWSFDQLDAPVLEADNDIYIDLQIAKELRGNP